MSGVSDRATLGHADRPRCAVETIGPGPEGALTTRCRRLLMAEALSMRDALEWNGTLDDDDMRMTRAQLTAARTLNSIGIALGTWAGDVTVGRRLSADLNTVWRHLTPTQRIVYREKLGEWDAAAENRMSFGARRPGS